MVRRLPPLNALRSFEAAARHLSFTKAANELNVTQAAVSHQIKTLEEALGVKLFRRLNRALLLTEPGQSYLPAVRDALDMLASATERLTRQDETGILTVSALPSLASIWLVPRINRFLEINPDIQVRIDASEHVVDFESGDVDVALRYGRGEYPGLHTERLMTEDIFPVCAPTLPTPARPLDRPEDLKHHTLLHDDLRLDWRMWLMAAGVEGVDPTRGLTFNASDIVIRAAIEGQGVALGRSALAADALADGQLIKPFDVILPADFAYYFVCAERDIERPKVRKFRDWLFSDVARGNAPGAPPPQALSWVP